MDQQQFDLVVIGGGPGGYGAALYATSAGLSVAVVEKGALGGTCLNRGCIPAKAFLESAAVNRHVQHAAEFGIESSAPVVNFAVAQVRKQKIVDGIVKSLGAFMKSKKITVLDGLGTLGANRTVTVQHPDGSSSTVVGTNVILASGSVPRTIPGFEPAPPGQHGPVMTSDEVLMLSSLPARVAVIGGGAIGCEFASTFADLGAQVTILEGLPKILPGLDTDVANVVVRSFKKKNIDIKTGVKVLGHTPNGYGGTTVHFGAADSDAQNLEVDAVVVSIGRRPFADQLGLHGTAVVVSDRGFVEVDQYCRTAEPGVYAVGDLINTPALAHVGYAEAILVTKHILGESPSPIRYDRVPWAIYCHPEVAFSGPSEEAAREAGFDVVVAKHQFRANSRAQILGELDGLVKVIAKKNADGSAGQILGVHMVGPWVTEQLSGGYLAVNWEATVAEVAEYIQPHPSLTELFGETVLSLTGRSLNA
ncbi:MAG: dihydrolipoyl dehydrogenase [Actinobacteria bacterium]|nr:dihydrolipoyl dehydrogenase [Acidimicrobiaceae bacterium]NMD23662.1 dihydrolipoyl dehydrogenase [Actinomycetota bacterium]